DSLNSYSTAIAYSTGTDLVPNVLNLNTAFQAQLSCYYCTCSFGWMCDGGSNPLFPGCNIHNNWSGDEVYVADFDGDGKSDIMHYHPSVVDCPSMTMESFFDIYYSTGTGFYRQNYPWNNNACLSQLDKYPPRMIADMNGDGKADLTVAVNNSADLQTL